VVSRAIKGECKAWQPALLIVVVLLVSNVFAEIPARSRITQLIHHDQLPAAEQQLWDVLSTHPDEVWALELMGEVRVRFLVLMLALALAGGAATIVRASDRLPTPVVAADYSGASW